MISRKLHLFILIQASFFAIPSFSMEGGSNEALKNEPAKIVILKHKSLREIIQSLKVLIGYSKDISDNCQEELDESVQAVEFVDLEELLERAFMEYYHKKYPMKEIKRGIELDDKLMPFFLELIKLIRLGDLSAVKSLLDENPEVNLNVGIIHLNPLNCAISEGNYEITKLLIDKGVDPNTKMNNNCETPASYARTAKMVKFLSEVGVDWSLCVNIHIEKGIIVYFISKLLNSKDSCEIKELTEMIKLILESGTLDGYRIVEAIRAMQQININQIIEFL